VTSEQTTSAGGPATPARRPRDSAATRETILNAGREVFAQLGYDRAGTREIAAAAGVDARLIGRYFGSKEGLFTAVIDRAFEKSMLMGPGHNRDAARALLTGDTTGPADGLLIAMRSAANQRAAAIMRADLEGRYQRMVADQLSGPHAAGRAALLIAICSGVQVTRDVIGNSALAGDGVEALVPYLEAALDAVSGP
jgi:AcrR family transcriptional regulator